MEIPFGLSAPAPMPAIPFTRIAELVFPEQTNHHGTLFGGATLALMDRAGYIAATRLTRRRMVTAAFKDVAFGKPVLPGQLAEISASIENAGRNSCEVVCDLVAEDLLTGDRQTAVSGRMVMVAMEAESDRSHASAIASPAPDDSLTQFVEVVFPDASNHRDILFGGEALSLMGKAAFIAATRHCRLTVVMAASEEVEFRCPVKVGEFAILTARILMTGKSSIRVGVDLDVEDPMTGDIRSSAVGRFTMVALDDKGRPAQVPPRLD